MTTSGSYDYSLTAHQIIEAAHRKMSVLGLGQSLSSSQLQNGLQALNLRIKMYPALIKKVWGTEFIVQGMQSPTTWIDDADATKNWEAIIPHTTAAINRPTSGANYIAYYKSSTTTGSSWSTAQTAVSKSAYNVDSDILYIENVRFLLESNRQKVDLELKTRKEFFNNLDLTNEGTPDSYYFERRTQSSNSTLYINPAPNDLNAVVTYDAIRYPQDVDASTNTLDFPQEWYSVLIYGIAIDMIPEYPAVSLKAASQISELYGQALDLARSLDEEAGNIRFIPG